MTALPAALAALALAGFGGAVALASGGEPTASAGGRAVVVATVGTPADELDHAVALARAQVGDDGAVVVRRAGGAQEAQAQVASAAAVGARVIVGSGDVGRAAVREGEAQDLGGPGLAWRTSR